MFSSIRPIAGEMPRRIGSGIACTIFSRIFRTERTRNRMPSIRMMHRAALNETRYVVPVMAAMFATTTAKKLFSPMPGAMTNGLFARNAIVIVPIAEAIQVAINTAFHSPWPSAPKFVSRFGFSATIYAIVMNVVRPARSSVRTFVWFFCR